MPTPGVLSNGKQYPDPTNGVLSNGSVIEPDARSHTQGDSITGINTYWAGKSRNHYCRLSYRRGGRIKHCHIPGGNIHNSLAQSRAQWLREELRRGREWQITSRIYLG